MTIRAILLAAAFLVPGAPRSAAAGTAVGERHIPQSWCFCLRPRPGWPPYYRDLSPGAPPECAGMKFAPSGDPIAELHTCEDTGQCWKKLAGEMKEFQDKRKTLSGHIKERGECRGGPLLGVPPSEQADYEKACLKMWDAVIQTDKMLLELNEALLAATMFGCFEAAPSKVTALEKLRGSEVTERRKAALFLANIAASTEAIPVLIGSVGRYDGGCEAVSALGRYGAAAGSAVAVLADTGVKNEVCPGSAAVALARIGTPDALAALGLMKKWERKWSPREQRLFRALSDGDPAVRGSAAAELSAIAASLKAMNDNAMPEKGKGIVAALEPLLGDPLKSVRYRTAIHLAELGAAPAGAIPVLIEAARDTAADEYSCAAAEALGKYGPAAKAAVTALTRPGVAEMFGKAEAGRPCRLLSSLERIDGPAASALDRSLRRAGAALDPREQRLLRALYDPGAAERAGAARELCSIAAGADQYKRGKFHVELFLRLKDKNKAVRYEAASCLAMTVFASDARPVLLEALGDPEGKYPGNAALELGMQGPAARAAVPELARQMNKKGFSYFWLQPASDAAAALEQIDTPEARAALAPLRKKERLAGVLAAPFAFLVFVPPLAPLTALFFVWLFLWSRARSREGRKFVHLPLLIPVLGWLYITYVVIFRLGGSGGYGGPFAAQLCLWLSAVTTLAGLLPWFAGCCLLRLRRRPAVIPSE